MPPLLGSARARQQVLPEHREVDAVHRFEPSSLGAHRRRDADRQEVLHRRRHRVGRGKASVYEALHTQLVTRFAIKFMRKPHPKALVRFEQEARLAASLAHPNVCRYFDIGKLPSGTRYIVMERLQGESLSRMLSRSPPTPSLAMHLVAQVLSGLQAAHNAKIIHRDVKPGNVFVEHVPDVGMNAKILDFGFAKDLSAGASVRTTMGRTVGTPAYISPEQLDGSPATSRSDLFSVGVLLYETLSPAFAPSVERVRRSSRRASSETRRSRSARAFPDWEPASILSSSGRWRRSPTLASRARQIFARRSSVSPIDGPRLRSVGAMFPRSRATRTPRRSASTLRSRSRGRLVPLSIVLFVVKHVDRGCCPTARRLRRRRPSWRNQ